MRICIFGAGGVGGSLAGRLARGGREVSVVARGAHLAAIRERGLRVITTDDDFTVQLPASDRPADLGKQDLVIVTTKTPALPEVAQAIGPLLGPDTLVAFALNGVFWFYGHEFAPGGKPLDTSRLDPDGTLHRLIGPERSLGMVIYSPNTVPEPGVVRSTGPTRFVIGEAVRHSTGRANLVSEALSGCGAEMFVSDDIRREMWQKLAGNNMTNTIPSLLTGASAKLVSDEPSVRAVGRALSREALAVAAAHGYPPPPPGEPVTSVASRTPAPNRPAHKPSILVDQEQNRPMEIDTQLTIIQDFARAAGVATPLLDAMMPLVILRARLAGGYGERLLDV